MRSIIRSCTMVGVVLVAGAAAAPAMAEGNMAVGLTAGTLGIAPEFSLRFSERAGVRVNGGFYTHKHNDEIDDIDYDARLKLNSVGAALDWYPLAGGFRASVGARVNGNKIELTGTPTEAVEIGNATFTPSQVGTLSGTIKTRRFAPTASIGYGGTVAKGFTLAAELGVVMQGSPRINELRASGTLASDPAFLAQLENERLSIEDDADDFKLWPIVQIGFHYRF